MDIDWILAGLAILGGAGMGAYGLINPHWAAKLVRLQEAAPGGAAEFRATYGGLFFLAHLVGLAFVWVQHRADNAAISAMAVGAITILAALWGGSALGRLVSIWRDKTGTPFNWASVGFETAFALMIAAPWLFWLVESTSR
jgi:hypothetical protein